MVQDFAVVLVATLLVHPCWNFAAHHHMQGASCWCSTQKLYSGCSACACSHRNPCWTVVWTFTASLLPTSLHVPLHGLYLGLC
jgi:hypothetical protein